MKLRDMLRLMRFLPNWKLNYVVLVLYGFILLVYTMPFGMGAGVAGFWAIYPIIYLLLQYQSITVAGFVQSSSKMRKELIKNEAKLFGIYNIVSFALFGVVRTILAFMTHTEQVVVPFLFAYVVFQLILAPYIVLFYKKPIFGYVLLGVVLVIMLGFHQDTYSIVQVDRIPIGYMIGATAVVCAAVPFLYYWFSLRMSKYSHSDTITKRLMRMG